MTKQILTEMFLEWKNIILHPNKTLSHLKDRSFLTVFFYIAFAGLIAGSTNKLFNALLGKQAIGVVLFGPFLAVGIWLVAGTVLWIFSKIFGGKQGLSKWLISFGSAYAPFVALIGIPYITYIVQVYEIYIIYLSFRYFTKLTRLKAAISLLSYAIFILLLFISINSLVLHFSAPKLQMTKNNITLDAYVACGKYGELIKYSECEHPENYKIVFYGTTDFNALVSEDFKRATSQNNTDLCKKLNNSVNCIASIAKKLQNKSICDEAGDNKDKCLERYEQILTLKKISKWTYMSNNIYLSFKDLDSLRVFGWLPQQKGWEGIHPEMKKDIDAYNLEVVRYNEIIKTENPELCLELSFKEVCVAHMGILQKDRQICDILHQLSDKCYNIYDNLEINNDSYYCEKQRDCEIKHQEEIIEEDAFCKYGDWKCEENKCIWICLERV